MTAYPNDVTQAKTVEASRETRALLTINGGSSSIRFALYEEGEPLRLLLNGKVDRVGLSGTNLSFEDSTGLSQDSPIIDPARHPSAVAFLLDWLETQQVFASVKAVRSETVAIRCMTLGVPAADAALYLVEKVGAARIRQVSEAANKVCERMLVACAAMSLKNCHRFRGYGNVPCLIDHR